MTENRELELDVKIYPEEQEGPVLAWASVCIGGCFAVRDIQIRQGKSGPFVSMPARRTKGRYRDVCFPCTKDFKVSFDRQILGAWRMNIQQEKTASMSAPDLGSMER